MAMSNTGIMHVYKRNKKHTAIANISVDRQFCLITMYAHDICNERQGNLLVYPANKHAGKQGISFALVI